MNLAHQRATPPKIQGIVQGWGDVLTKCGKVGKKDLVAAARNILGARGLTKRWKIIFPIMLNPRTGLAFFHDIAAAAATWVIAFWLRFNLEVPQPYDTLMLES